MKGEQLNNLCKTLTIMDTEVHMVGELKVIDPPHVILIEVKTHDGTPVFGCEGPGMVDVNKIFKMKIGAKEEFTTHFQDGKYTLVNDEGKYQFQCCEVTEKLPKVPKLGDLNYVQVEKKPLEAFVNQASIISDRITLVMENGELRGRCEGDGVSLDMKLGTCDSYLNVKSMYPVDYMKKIMKVVGSTLTIGLHTDWPMTIEWNDKYYQYKVLLAPRIEAE